MMSFPGIVYPQKDQLYTCELDNCRSCGERLELRSFLQSKKTVQTLSERLHLAHQTKRCQNPTCSGEGIVWPSCRWQQIAPHDIGYGYDVIAQIPYVLTVTGMVASPIQKEGEAVIAANPASRYPLPKSYWRQFKDMKGSFDITQFDAKGVAAYLAVCGLCLARAHACSGDPTAISSYLGSSDTFDKAIGKFSVAYADQTEKDHQALLDAIRNGRVVAEPGV